MLHTLALLLSPLLVQAPDASLDSLWGDWNADGREDLLLVEDGSLRLFEDGGSVGLREVTAVAGLDVWSGLSGVLWEDLDGDGAADLLLARHAGEGALLTGLVRGGWQPQTAAAGLDLARPLSRVRRAGTSLMLEGPDGVRLARFDAARGWSELELGAPARALTIVSDTLPLAEEPAPLREREAAPTSAPLTVGVGGTSSSALLPPLNGICAGFIEDQATGTCLPASSLPILGTIYPLSVNWNVTPAGNVGIGTTTPGAKLEVVGDVRAQQFVSTASIFSAPLVVASSVKVANLNADKLDGLDSSVFSQLGNSIEGSEITLGTITADRLASPLVGNGVSGPTLYATASGLGASALNGVGTGGTGNIGVRGESTSTSGLAFGVRGISASTSGRGLSGENTATSGAANGVYASTTSSSGTALQALASATTGNTFGVSATASSTTGIAVYGLTTAATGASTGVYGHVTSTGGSAVRALASATTGNTFGVFATNASSSGVAVYGLNSSSSGDNYGVVGEVSSNAGAGVLGEAFNGYAGAPSSGVLGKHSGPYGNGVKGDATNIGSSGAGVRGLVASGKGYGVYSSGDLGASGVKSFVQPHPADASREIRFVCLEGNESGTYFRGTTELVGGQAVVAVPEEFRLVSEAEGVTVQLTARGPGRLWIESVDLDAIVIRGDARAADYFVNGVRRGFADIELVRENHQWVPEVRGVPYGTQYPAALRQILVENGTLNPDFTPNEATAAARGWTLHDPAPVDPMAALRARSE